MSRVKRARRFPERIQEVIEKLRKSNGLDAKRYTPEDLAALYRARWHAALHLRSLKSVLQMEHLRCDKPEMVRKEIAMHLIAYHVLRNVMAEAARHQDLTPGQFSFKGALQTFKAFREEGLLLDIRRIEC